MGSYQTKCSCGKFSKVEIIATIDRAFILSRSDDNMSHIFSFGLDVISKLTNHTGWSGVGFEFLLNDKVKLTAYTCEECAFKISKALNSLKNTQIDYIMNKNEKGFWRTDLP